MALDSCAQFLAVPEHRLIPARAKSIGHHLRKADRQSVCAPACQDQISGGHAGVGVISSRAAPLSAPSLVTAEYQGVLSVGQGHDGYFFLLVTVVWFIFSLSVAIDVSNEDSEKLAAD